MSHLCAICANGAGWGFSENRCCAGAFPPAKSIYLPLERKGIYNIFPNSTSVNGVPHVSHLYGRRGVRIFRKSMLRRRILAPPNRVSTTRLHVDLQYLAKFDRCDRCPACVPPVCPAWGPNFPEIDVAPAHLCPARSIPRPLEWKGVYNIRPYSTGVAGSPPAPHLCGRCGVGIFRKSMLRLCILPCEIDFPATRLEGVYNIRPYSTGVPGVPPVCRLCGRLWVQIFRKSMLRRRISPAESISHRLNGRGIYNIWPNSAGVAGGPPVSHLFGRRGARIFRKSMSRRRISDPPNLVVSR